MSNLQYAVITACNVVADELSFTLANLEQLHTEKVVQIIMRHGDCHRLNYNQAVVSRHSSSGGQNGNCTVSLTF